MPIGPYKDFDACVAANRDKGDPEAYCAALERKIKGQMPENSFGHTVEGVEIFAAGTWTDSQGQEREWGEADLNKLLKNFEDDSSQSAIPVKVGHTDDTFNNRVADELGIPSSLLTGDGGSGAARLGHISRVYREGEKLLADFENVPDAITNMIKEGMFNAVSVEIDMPEDDDPHLSGVAILGAEMPAVGVLASLDQASVYSHMAASKKPWVTLRFADGEPEQIDPEVLAREFAEIREKFEEVIRGKKGARLFRNLWRLMADKVGDMTGKKFSQSNFAGNWEAIIETQRNTTLNLPLETVARLSPEMGGQMGQQGMTKLKIKNFEIPDELMAPMLELGGEADDSYFDRLMALDMGIEGWDKVTLCAILTKKRTGNWPVLSNDGGVEHQEKEPIAPNGTGEEEDNKLNHKLEEVMNEFVLAPEDLPRLYEALGLPDTAGIEDVLAAIMALKGEEMPPEEEMPPMEMPMAEEDKDKRIAELEQQVASLTGFAREAKHEKLVMTYTKQASEWNGISGTPEELGVELAELHETAGEAVAQRLVMRYQAMHEDAKKAGVLAPIGSVSKDEKRPDEYELKINEYAKENHVTNEQAMAHFAHAEPKEFGAYSRRVMQSVVKGGK